CFFFFSSRRRHTRSYGDWSSDVCSSDLETLQNRGTVLPASAQIVDLPGPRVPGECFEGADNVVAVDLIANLLAFVAVDCICAPRSEERRVGKECRSRSSASQSTEKEVWQ